MNLQEIREKITKLETEVAYIRTELGVLVLGKPKKSNGKRKSHKHPRRLSQDCRDALELALDELGSEDLVIANLLRKAQELEPRFPRVHGRLYDSVRNWLLERYGWSMSWSNVDSTFECRDDAAETEGED